jgi:enoyl reductase-like protein
MPRIKDRFTATGRKLSADEKAAVAELHAKYPDVPARTVPDKRATFAKKFCRVRANPVRLTPSD